MSGKFWNVSRQIEHNTLKKMLRDGATVRMSREDKYHFNIKCFLYIFWHFKSIVIMIGLCMDDLCSFFEHLTFH